MDGDSVNAVRISRQLDTSADDSMNGDTCGGEAELMTSHYTTITRDTKKRTPNTDENKDNNATNAPRAKCRRRAANVLERVRVQRMNTAMEDLRRCLPPHVRSSFSPRQKLSKILTLRLATSYIAALGEMLTIGEHGRRPHHVRQSYRRALGLPSREGDIHTCLSEHTRDLAQCRGCEHSQIKPYEA